MTTKPKAYSYIRFSTPEQEKGDSLRRQERQAEDYAIKHGLMLDESQKFKDLGKSGYKGFNRIDGALKDFIDLVDKGEIPEGSVLIVEHLDRLSREKVSVALRLFMDLLEKGIQIVTLQDHQRYDKSSIDENPTQLIISITLMSAAHDESLKKSKRIREALEEKREKLRENKIKIYSAKPPLWLKLSEDKTKFVQIPKACEAIRLIFKKRLEGKGSYKIEKELNSDPDVWKPPVSPQNKSGGWRDAYINKLLRNRKLIGEYQPHEMKTKTITRKNGKEAERAIPVAIGDPIKNYYPQIIDEALFYKAQELIKQNGKFPGNGGGGGNKDKGSNLFTHVVKCGICGSSMQYVDKGFQYLICDSKRRKNEVPITTKKDKDKTTVEMVCTAKSVRYDEFERIFFENFDELDISKLLPNEDKTTKLKKEKGAEILKNKLKLNDLESQIDNLLETISLTDDQENKKIYDQKITEKRSTKEILLAKNINLEQEIKDLVEHRKILKEQKDSITEAYSFLASAKDEQERIDRRLQLRQEIKNMIEWIKIYTLQEEYKEYEEIEPGIIQHMASKTIDRIRIKLKGSETLLRIIYLKSAGEIIE
jgi:DNA invertase Pin-like site-specific DNA recombinase